MIAPIILFVYNRPEHTQKTLDALHKNELASDSILYIFADGLKDNIDKEEIKNIEATRKSIRRKNWCKEVIIFERDLNIGLAASILEGVTKIVNKHGKVIVLEDDIVTSPGFLKYMNASLDLYESEVEVMHISGYMFPVKGNLPETFFYKQTSCWGWGTWKTAWKFLEISPQKLLNDLQQSNKITIADIDGTNQFMDQLHANINGTLNTWAVLWHFSVFLKEGLSLHPRKSLVKNIGMDNSGTNFGKTNRFNVQTVKRIDIYKIPIKDLFEVYMLLNTFYKKSPKNLQNIIVRKLKLMLPITLKHALKMLIIRSYRISKIEKSRINQLPRFTEGETIFLGKKIRFVDNASFNFITQELFEQGIYKFNCESKNPYIIDCGANIGLSIIYFKQLFPDAEIIGFEPDPKVFDILQHNLKVFNYTDVELINKACWNIETKIKFYSEGADAGRAAQDFDKEKIIEVGTTRLGTYLSKKVDFLKIDIEGAESEVLVDIKNLLFNVDRIFIEFHSFVGREQMLSEILSIMKNNGFRINIHTAGRNSPHPFVSSLDYGTMDFQLNIFGYRL